MWVPPLIPWFRITAAESVQDVFDIYTIIFLALAVFIFLRLRSVLGQRTGRERPPYDPYSARDPVRGGPTNDNVVTLPGRSGTDSAQKPLETAEALDRWKGIAEAGSPLASGLDAILRDDKSFDAKHFIAGARAAYEMIVLAYAEGDRRALKNLLSRDVYEGFRECDPRARDQGRDCRNPFCGNRDGLKAQGSGLRQDLRLIGRRFCMSPEP